VVFQANTSWRSLKKFGTEKAEKECLEKKLDAEYRLIVILCYTEGDYNEIVINLTSYKLTSVISFIFFLSSDILKLTLQRRLKYIFV